VSSVADPDPYVFGPPGSGFISQRYGSGSFPFFQKCADRAEIMLANHDFKTKFEKKINFKTVGKLKNMKKIFASLNL
jgi:hypothetical protein